MTVYDSNAVPIIAQIPGQKLGLSQSVHTTVQKAHDKGDLLLGESVVLDNPDPERGNFTGFSIGASTLQEALTEVIGAFDSSHVGPPDQSSDEIHTPAWVASTHKELGKALADYYSCELRPIAEVLG